MTCEFTCDSRKSHLASAKPSAGVHDRAAVSTCIHTSCTHSNAVGSCHFGVPFSADLF